MKRRPGILMIQHALSDAEAVASLHTCYATIDFLLMRHRKTSHL